MGMPADVQGADLPDPVRADEFPRQPRDQSDHLGVGVDHPGVEVEHVGSA
jgi:hypothetical protein